MLDKISEIVARLPDTYIAKKQVRGILESEGITINASGLEISEFNRLLNIRRERESDQRTAELAAEREREVARKDFAQQGRAVEIKLMANVEPHWPTYHRMMDLCRDLADMFDAIKARDVGDIMATKSAAKQIPEMLFEFDIEEDSVTADIWDRVVTYHTISDAQAKALAVAVAKAATLKGKK